MRLARTVLLSAALWPNAGAPASLSGAQVQPSVRARIQAMEFPELEFSPPRVRAKTVATVPVYFLEDRSLPLVTFYVSFKGGVRRLPRERFAAASGLPALLRNGGTAALTPEEVDDRIETLALSMSFGQGGGGSSSWVNTLTENVNEAVSLWSSMLRAPRFDSAEVELWRGAELERVRRQADDPASLAFRRFNAIMYGEHPVGWSMEPSDLEPTRLSPASLRFVHQAVVCPENMTLGVAGDIAWEQAAALFEAMLADWPPCSAGLLSEEPEPRIRTEPGVFVLHKAAAQSVVVLAHASTVRRDGTSAYFASRVGNAILGASGLSSRLNQTLRTREGLAYSASSLWTTPRRSNGLVGAMTNTKPETTLAAARLLLSVIESMRAHPPSSAEVARTIDEASNGFAFNFRTPSQIVARNLAYRNLGLPADWLEIYVEGIRRVTPAAVHQTFRNHVDPARMTILLLGDTTRFDGSASELGNAVTALAEAPWSPRESPRPRP